VAKQAAQNEHDPRSDSICEEEAKRDVEVAVEDEDMPLASLPEGVPVTSSPPAVPGVVAYPAVATQGPQDEVKQEVEKEGHKAEDILDGLTTASMIASSS